MLEIAVCDDETLITAQIEKMLEEITEESVTKIEVDVFYDGSSLVEHISQGKRYDIIYLDIEMTKQNGIDAAWNIRKLDKKVLIIYVTSHESLPKKFLKFPHLDLLQNQ